jgi:Tol biopolymer transport system component
MPSPSNFVRLARSCASIAIVALLSGVSCGGAASPGGATGLDASPPPSPPPTPPSAPPTAPPVGPAYVRVAFVNADRLVAMNADGTGRVELAQGDFADLAVSPDRSRIAFTRANNVFVMNADASGIRQLTTQGGRDPSWSADGSRIAFVGSDDAIHTMLADGSSQRRLTTPHLDEGEVDYAPSWSPDGRYLVFTRWEYGEFTVLWTVNADGTNAAQLGRREPFGSSYRTWASWTPVWSRAANRIVFAGPSSAYTPTVFTMNGDGADVVEVYSGPASHVMYLVHDASPDAKWILVTNVIDKAICLLGPGLGLMRVTEADGSHSPAILSIRAP